MMPQVNKSWPLSQKTWIEFLTLGFCLVLPGFGEQISEWEIISVSLSNKSYK